MERKIGYQSEENYYNNILPENQNELKNDPINGSGSESQLESIISDKKEIDHSTKSSIEPIPTFNNSMTNSNENTNQTNININGPNNSVNPYVINEKTLIGDDISGIKNISIGSNNEINDIIYMLKEEHISKDYGKKNNNLSDSNISQNNNEIQNEQNHNNNDTNINNNSQNKNHKNNESNNSKKKNILNKENKLEIKNKIKEGYIPFFIRVKGYNHVFFYGKPDIQIKIPITHYMKKVGIPRAKNCSFKYDNNVIDINKTIGESGIVKFCVIEGEIL